MKYKRGNGPMKAFFKNRIQRMENVIEQKEGAPLLQWPTFEDILEIIIALNKGDEKTLEKFHPVIIGEFRKICQKNSRNKISS